jgi:hypothetical protein
VPRIIFELPFRYAVLWVHFRELLMVLQKVPQFNFENGYIPEESFQLLHERPNIENSNQANLNDFVTNRQHCLLIGNNKLNELNNRTKRRGRQIVCSTQRVCLLKLTKEVSGSNVGSPDARKSFVVQICAMPSEPHRGT